jgi:hypothetical protein
MTPMDIVGAAVLLLATVIACNELALCYALRAAARLKAEPCRERPSALPDWRQGPR